MKTESMQRTFHRVASIIVLFMVGCCWTYTLGAQVSFRWNELGECPNAYAGFDLAPARWTQHGRSDSTQISDFAIAMAQGRFRYDWVCFDRITFGPSVDARFGLAFTLNTGARIGWTVGLNDSGDSPFRIGVRGTVGYDLSFNPEYRTRARFYTEPFVEASLVYSGRMYGSIHVSLSKTLPRGADQYAEINMLSFGVSLPIFKSSPKDDWME